MFDRDEMASRYFAGDLDDRETALLGEWIKSGKANSRWFAEQMFIQARLESCLRGKALCGKETTKIAHHLRAVRRQQERRSAGTRKLARGPLAFGLLAASVLIAVVLSARLLEKRSSVPAVATLTSSLDAKWADGRGPASGAGLTAGVYELSDGLARIDFANGANAVVQGPARFELSASHLKLSSGKAVVTCPTIQSRSLVSEVEGAKVEDLGTEYGLAAFPTGFSEVRVFQGVIRLTCGPESMNPVATELGAGDGRKIDRHLQLPEPLQHDGVRFVRAGEFEARLRGQDNSDAGRRWQNAVRMLADPDLICWLDMNPAADKSSTQNLIGQGPWIHTADEFHAAHFIGGRVEGENAIEFNHPGDALRIKIPGQFQNLTLATWVKLNAEDPAHPRHRGLLMSDRWGTQQQIHWQMKGPALHLSFYAKDDEDSRFSAAFDGLRDDGWHQLVSVVLAGPEKVTIRHYVDGAVIYERSAPLKNPSFTFGSCCIGGWAAPPQKAAGDDRTLNGAMSNLMVWRRALAPGEIKCLFESGGTMPAGDLK